jgi:hypothetical protein
MNIFPTNKSQAACLFSLEALPSPGGYRYLWTLTTPDVVELKVISHRWLTFLKRFKRAFPQVSGVRVFELHAEEFSHGWHVHFVLGERIDVGWVRENAEACGFGRVNVVRVPAKQSEYVAKYLTKQDRLHWMKGARLWGRWGPFKGTRVADIVCKSPATRAFDYCKKLRDWVGVQFRAASFHGKSTIVNWFLREDLLSGGKLYGFYEPLPASCYVGAG